MSGARTSTFAGVGTAYVLSSEDELADDERFTIHGVALGVNDITIGKSGTKKLWPADELRKAADTLEGQPFVRDHQNSTQGKVGEVTHAEFVEDVGVVYEAEIAPHYDELIADFEAGLMEVSIRAYHAEEDELEEDEATGALVVENIAFDNLSAVNKGASPSNSAQPGGLDAVGGAESIEASVQVGGNGQAVATLERSAPVDADTVADAFEADEEAEETDDTTAEELAPDGIFTADGTWFAVGPDEHADDSTEHAQDAKYPITSCTGENSLEAAWNLRANGDYDIDQATLESRLRAAAEAMDCDPSIVGMDDDEESADSSAAEDTAEDADTAVLVDWHEVYYEETTEDDFEDPELADFGLDGEWDDLSEVEQEIVSEHFLLSESGFPPEDFTDLRGAVVDPDGTLSQTALEEFRASIEDGEQSELVEWIDNTLDEEFEEAEDSTVAPDATTPGTRRVALLAAPTNPTMIDYEPADAEELEDELDDPVVVDRDELESLADKAEKADAVQDDLQELSQKVDEQNEAVDIVDELSEDDIEQIQGDDDVVVMDAEEASMVEDVSTIYAEELAEYSPFTAEELAETFDPLDLKERVEDHDEASLAETIEDTEPEPDAGDVDDDELGDDGGDGGDEPSDEELREQRARELEEMGWTRQAEKMRAGEIPLDE